MKNLNLHVVQPQKKALDRGYGRVGTPPQSNYSPSISRGVRNVHCFQIPPYGSLLRLGRLDGLISDDNHDSGAL